jgi:hypothetical protein
VVLQVAAKPEEIEQQLIDHNLSSRILFLYLSGGYSKIAMFDSLTS